MLSFILAVLAIWLILKWRNLLFPSKPKPLNFVALDFETASSVKHSICQVGMVVVNNSEIVTSQTWLVHPHSKHFSEDNTSIHGITYAMVKDAPTFDTIWPEINKHITTTGVVAAHYALFDISVLCAVLDYYNLSRPKFQVIDSCITARTTWPHLPNHKLKTVAEYLKIDLQHHDALSDATACAKILIEASKNRKLLQLHPDDCINSKEYKKIFFE